MDLFKTLLKNELFPKNIFCCAYLGFKILMPLCKTEKLKLLNFIAIGYICRDTNCKINGENGSSIGPFLQELWPKNSANWA